MKKPQILWVLLALLCFCLPTVSHASKMGGAITWKYLATDTYLVNLAVYTDCNGFPTGNTDILVTPTSGGTPFTLKTTGSASKDVTPVCKKSCTRCGNPGCSFPYGVSLVNYTARLVFTGAYTKICAFTLSWADSTRLNIITTGPQSQPIYVESKLDRCIAPTNNSPQFISFYPNIICSKQCTYLDVSAMDNDTNSLGKRDSLVYSLVTPLVAKGKGATFSSPYTWDKPIKFSGWPNKIATWAPPKCDGLHLDAQTGMLYFMSTKNDITALDILLEEYSWDKTGKPFKKGEVRREIELIIIDCKNNKIPNISGINGSSDYTIDLWEGTNNCFTINSSDPDPKDTVKLSWDNGAKLDSFVIETGKQFPRATICLKTTAAMVNAPPIHFNVSAKDVACPTPGFTNRYFSIRVWPKTILKVKDSLDPCGMLTLIPKLIQGPPLKYFRWIGTDSLKDSVMIARHQYKKPGTYKWKLEAYGPGWSYTDSGTVNVTISKTRPKASLITGPLSTCLNNNDKYGATFTSGNTYFWRAMSGKISPVAGHPDSIWISWNKTGKDTIHMIESNGCADSSKLIVNILGLPVLKFTATNTGSRTYSFTASNTTLNKYIWNFGDGKIKISTYNESHIYAKDSTFKVILMATDANGCTATSDTTLKLYTNIVEQETLKPNLTIHPNPFQNQTTINYHLDKKSNITIRLNDIQGRLIKTLTNETEQAGDHSLIIDAPKTGLSPGTYILHFIKDNEMVSKEIIKLE